MHTNIHNNTTMSTHVILCSVINERKNLSDKVFLNYLTIRFFRLHIFKQYLSLAVKITHKYIL